ncbi:MAG: AAA family ATPase [Firmicutes bacterium]|nr:AAA family ATPase [Bacillota bacterium]
MNKSIIIAMTGKGGVGKTSLSAAIVKELVKAHPDKKILAIDADPAVGLATALGVEVKTTVDDIRVEFIKQAEQEGTKQAIEYLGEAKYRIFEALSENEHFSFLAIGRPEAAGCYCKVNAYLKQIISILAENFDYVVIDGEAGIEQVNRRVMEKVTHLVLVSDASKKGIQVIQSIDEVAKRLTMYEKAGVILNRLSTRAMTNDFNLGELPILARIGTDEDLLDCDMEGDCVFDLDDTAKIVVGAKKALQALEII